MITCILVCFALGVGVKLVNELRRTPAPYKPPKAVESRCPCPLRQPYGPRIVHPLYESDVADLCNDADWLR